MGFVVNYPPVTKVTVDETTNEVVVAAAGPRGPQGAQGDPGAAASVAVGSTTTGAVGSDASVANSGTSSAAVLDFTIPRGDTGATGATGPQGDPGVVAATAPLTYDSGTQTVALDESGIEIAPSQVTGTAVVDNDSRLSDARTPTAHASSHESGGGDELTLAQSQVTNLTTDLAAKAPLASPTFTGIVEAADIEVSGGVFLGGTAAANELDDYEEGTWTPTYEPATGAFGSVTYQQQEGIYRKVGNLVHVQGRLRISTRTAGTESGNLEVHGFPFSSNVAGVGGVGGSALATDQWGSSPTFICVFAGNDYALLGEIAKGDAAYTLITVSDMGITSNDCRIDFSFTYTTA